RPPDDRQGRGLSPGRQAGVIVQLRQDAAPVGGGDGERTAGLRRSHRPRRVFGGVGRRQAVVVRRAGSQRPAVGRGDGAGIAHVRGAHGAAGERGLLPRRPAGRVGGLGPHRAAVETTGRKVTGSQAEVPLFRGRSKIDRGTRKRNPHLLLVSGTLFAFTG